MTDELDHRGRLAADAIHRDVARHADPDTDLAAILAGGHLVAGHEPEHARRGPPWWFLGAAAAGLVAVLIAAVVFVVIIGGDNDSRTIAPVTVPSIPSVGPTGSGPPVSASTAPGSTVAPPIAADPQVTAPVNEVTGNTTAARSAPSSTSPATAPSAPPASDDAPSSAQAVAAHLNATCPEPWPCEVQYGPTGDAVVFDRQAQTLTVLRTPAAVFPIAARPGANVWFAGVGPDNVAYFPRDSGGDSSVTQIYGMPTSGDRAGTLIAIGDPFPTDPAWAVRMVPAGLELCCDEAKPRAPYIDSAGAPLPNDPSQSRWSWEWPVGVGTSSAVMLTDGQTGQQFTVPEPRVEMEGPRGGGLRSLFDGRVVFRNLDESYVDSYWVLDPATGTWTSTAVGDENVATVTPDGFLLVAPLAGGDTQAVPLN